MTKIYYDPTEARFGTRLSDTIIELGNPLQHLEQYTKADLLITLEDKPITGKEPSKLLETKLKNACQNGMLIQRKSGGDFVNSIPELTKIINIMREWSNYCWIVWTGDISKTNEGNLIIEQRETGWNYQAVIGKIESIQADGGYFLHLLDDTEFEYWCRKWLENKLEKWYQDENKIVSKGEVRKVTILDHDLFSSLSVFPKGLGVGSMLKLVGGLEQAGIPRDKLTPYLVLSIATNHKLMKQFNPPGWGEKSVSNLREWWQLADGQDFDVSDKGGMNYKGAVIDAFWSYLENGNWENELFGEFGLLDDEAKPLLLKLKELLAPPF